MANDPPTKMADAQPTKARFRPSPRGLSPAREALPAAVRSRALIVASSELPRTDVDVARHPCSYRSRSLLASLSDHAHTHRGCTRAREPACDRQPCLLVATDAPFACFVR